MDVWVPLVAAAIGAFAGVGGAVVVTRGQAQLRRRDALGSVYAQFLTAAHDAELYLQGEVGRRTIRALPDRIDRAIIYSLATMVLNAPRDTHTAAALYGEALRGDDIHAELHANDVRPNVERWERAIVLMRRDLKSARPPRRFLPTR